MRLSAHLDTLLDDLVDFQPNTLSDIVRFVRCHSDFNAIVMMVRNSERSSKSFLKQCQGANSDIELAGLLVIVAEIDHEMYDGLVSRASAGVGNYHWSQGVATTYLIQKVLNETIRKSA
jgi:hypothetical protein